MDFFDGLDNGHYAEFKKSILNGMTAGSVTQLATLNEMYLLANQWLKTTGVTQSGLASTFVTKLDMPSQEKGGKKDEKDGGKQGKASEMKQGKRDMSKIKCFYCNEFGHIAPNCPKKAKQAEERAQKAETFVSWDDNVDEEQVAGTFFIYQVCHRVKSGQKFHDYDLLLDNQADISVVHPRLLWQVMAADKPVTMNDIGGRQLVVTQTGYLDEFFRVYASEDVKPNRFSSADVEDMFPVTYVPGKAFMVHLPGRDLEFARTGKLYVVNLQMVLEPSNVHATGNIYQSQNTEG
jgi:hypothetical protein